MINNKLGRFVDVTSISLRKNSDCLPTKCLENYSTATTYPQEFIVAIEFQQIDYIIPTNGQMIMKYDATTGNLIFSMSVRSTGAPKTKNLLFFKDNAGMSGDRVFWLPNFKNGADVTTEMKNTFHIQMMMFSADGSSI